MIILDILQGLLILILAYFAYRFAVNLKKQRAWEA